MKNTPAEYYMPAIYSLISKIPDGLFKGSEFNPVHSRAIHASLSLQAPKSVYNKKRSEDYRVNSYPAFFTTIDRPSCLISNLWLTGNPTDILANEISAAHALYTITTLTWFGKETAEGLNLYTFNQEQIALTGWFRLLVKYFILNPALKTELSKCLKLLCQNSEESYQFFHTSQSRIDYKYIIETIKSQGLNYLLPSADEGQLQTIAANLSASVLNSLVQFQHNLENKIVADLLETAKTIELNEIAKLEASLSRLNKDKRKQVKASICKAKFDLEQRTQARAIELKEKERREKARKEKKAQSEKINNLFSGIF